MTKRRSGTEGKVGRSLVPDTVIVVTAGVMPASLWSIRAGLASLQAYLHTHTSKHNKSYLHTAFLGYVHYSYSSIIIIQKRWITAFKLFFFSLWNDEKNLDTTHRKDLRWGATEHEKTKNTKETEVRARCTVASKSAVFISESGDRGQRLLGAPLHQPFIYTLR